MTTPRTRAFRVSCGRCNSRLKILADSFQESSSTARTAGWCVVGTAGWVCPECLKIDPDGRARD